MDDAVRAEVPRGGTGQARAGAGGTAAVSADQDDTPGRGKQSASDKAEHGSDSALSAGQTAAAAGSEVMGAVVDDETSTGNNKGETAPETVSRGVIGGDEAEGFGGVIGSADAPEPGPESKLEPNPEPEPEPESEVGSRGSGTAGNGSGGKVDAAEMRQATAEAGARLGETAADVAERAAAVIGELPDRATGAVSSARERASSAIDSLPGRMTDQRQRYALIGAAVAVVSIAVVVMRRLR